MILTHGVNGLNGEGGHSYKGVIRHRLLYTH